MAKIFEYLFNEAIGATTINDTSGLGNNAEINPVSPGLTPAVLTTEETPPGYAFKSLKFSVDDMPPGPVSGAEPDNQLQFLKVPLTASIRNIDSTRAFTVSFWAYHAAADDPTGNPWDGPETSAGKDLFCPQHTCGAEAFYLFVRTKNIGESVPVDERGELAFTGDGPQVIQAGGIAQTALGGVTSQGYHVPVNEWVHIAGVLVPPVGFAGADPAWPDGVWRLYVNGVLRGERAANPSLADTSQLIFPNDPAIDIRFGNFRGVNRPSPIAPGANDYAFNGYLTGIRMYDHGQSAAEVCADIAADAQLPTTSLVSPTPGSALDFGTVVERRTTARAIRIGVRSCTPVRIEVADPNGPFTLADPGPLFSSPGDEPTEQREKLIWILYAAGPSDPLAGPDTGDVVVTIPDTGETYTIPLRAQVRARPTTASVLVLDRSGSMIEDAGAGGGIRKIDLLRGAATSYVDAIREGDGIGVVRYNANAPAPSVAIQDVGPDDISIAGRAAAKTFIRGPELNPDGGTSIGDGIFEASNLLASSSADVKAMVVMTDGNENAPRSIADVAPDLTTQTYAVGLGAPANTSAEKLDEIVRNTGGYQLITGTLDQDNQLKLHKYFLQILGDVSNAEIVTDPDFLISAKDKQIHPFTITEADIDADVYFMSRWAWALDCILIAPNGDVINPARAAMEPNMRFVAGNDMHFYRLALPAFAEKPEDHIGEWKAVVSLGRHYFKEFQHEKKLPPVRYAFMTQAQSNLTMRANLTQDSLAPNSTLTFGVRLFEYDRPIQQNFDVFAELIDPDGNESILRFSKAGPGQYLAEFIDTALPGVYTARIIARGRSLRGAAVTRERIVTGSIIKRTGAASRPEGLDDVIDIIKEQTDCLKELCEAARKPQRPTTHNPAAVASIAALPANVLSDITNAANLAQAQNLNTAKLIQALIASTDDED